MKEFLPRWNRRTKPPCCSTTPTALACSGRHGRGLLDDFGQWTEANGQPGRAAGCACSSGAPWPRRSAGLAASFLAPPTLSTGPGGPSHYFDGASAPASAVAGSSAKALEIVLREPELRQRLQDNASRLREGLRSLGLTPPEGRAAHLGLTTVPRRTCFGPPCSRSRTAGILLPYVSTYSGLPPEGNLRFSVFATHTAEQIDRSARRIALPDPVIHPHETIAPASPRRIVLASAHARHRLHPDPAAPARRRGEGNEGLGDLGRGARA